MRPADDLALRAQNWFWYWHVRELSQRSNDQLDERCFGDVGRKRHFERIQQSASSPDEFALFDGQTLMSVVDRWDAPGDNLPGPFASATQAFKSRLWEFLATRELLPAEYSSFIQAYVHQQGWHRAQARDLSLYRMCLGESEPAIEPGVSIAYSAMLHRLANDATPDSLAVLIALFREAVHGVLLQEALAIKPAIGATVYWLCRKYAMPDRVTQLLSRLVDDRILSNVWVSENDWRQHTSTLRGTAKSSRARIKELHAWVAWYIDDCPKLGATGYGQFPIVPHSPRIEWVEENRKRLTLAYGRVLELRQHHWVFEDSMILSANESANVALRAADEIVREMRPPHQTPARFYDKRPDLEIGRLPPAFEPSEY